MKTKAVRTIEWDWMPLGGVKGIVGEVSVGLGYSIRVAIRPQGDSFDLVFLWANGRGHTLITSSGSKTALKDAAARYSDEFLSDLAKVDEKRRLGGRHD